MAAVLAVEVTAVVERQNVRMMIRGNAGDTRYRPIAFAGPHVFVGLLGTSAALKQTSYSSTTKAPAGTDKMHEAR